MQLGMADLMSRPSSEPARWIRVRHKPSWALVRDLRRYPHFYTASAVLMVFLSALLVQIWTPISFLYQRQADMERLLQRAVAALEEDVQIKRGR